MNIAVLPKGLLSGIVDRLVYSLYLIKLLDCITFRYYKGEMANTNLRLPQRCVTEGERGNNRTTPTVDYNQDHTRKKQLARIQSTLGRTALGPTLSVLLREMSVL